MTLGVLAFPHPLYAEMMAHVLSDPTLEMCGLLAGRAGVVDRVWPVPNALQSPVAYRMDGPEFAAAMIGCDLSRWASITRIRPGRLYRRPPILPRQRIQMLFTWLYHCGQRHPACADS
jgi:hypothetical protein